MADKEKMSSLDREVQAYLKPPNHRLFSGYIAVNEMGKSEGINVIVNEFFSRMSEDEKKRYQNHSKNSY